MKIFTVLLFILAVLGAQAKFNLRTYAQHKLRGDGTAGNHIIHTETDIDVIVDKVVNECFDGQLGKNNAVISNTRSATGFDIPAAIDGINLCLQSKNLRLGHKVDANLTSTIDAVKVAAVDLNRANDEYNTLIEQVAPGLTAEMSTIESAVTNAETSLKTAYKESSGESNQQAAQSLEDFLSNKEAEYKHVLSELKKDFQAFSTATTDDIASLSEKIKYVKTNETEFSNKKSELSANVEKVVKLIKAHYKTVEEGTGERNAVSGTPGEGCGKLTSTTPTGVVEQSDSTMCDDGLKCVERSGNNIKAMSNNQKDNLVYSGKFICVAQLVSGDTAITDTQQTLQALDCSHATEAKLDATAASTCNLYLLG